VLPQCLAADIGSRKSATGERASTTCPTGQSSRPAAKRADNDPLVAHGWIYAYDPDEE
jgi:hypothetical protein